MREELHSLERRVNKLFQRVKLLGDIPISETEYQLLLGYFIKKSQVYLKKKYFIEDRLYTVALVQIGIHEYDGRFWPHVRKILGLDNRCSQTKLNNIIFPFKYTLSFYKKDIVDQHENVNTILMHGFVSNHYIGYLFDFLYRFYMIDIERDLNWEYFGQTLNYMIDMIQNEDQIEIEQSDRKYILVKQTVDGIRHSTKQSVGMKFRWLLKTIDKLTYDETINMNSKSRLIKAFINWAETSEYKKKLDKLYASSKGNGLSRNSTAFIKFFPRTNSFVLMIPSQRFLARHSDELTSFLNIGEKRIEINIGQNEYSTLIKTNDFKHEIMIEDLFKPVSIEYHLGSEHRTSRVITGDPIIFFDYMFESTRVSSDRQLVSIGQVYAFSLPKTHVEFTGALEEYSLGVYPRYSMMIQDDDYIVVNSKKLYTVKGVIEDSISISNKVNNTFSDDIEVYSDIPIIFFKATMDKMPGVILKINESVIRPQKTINIVEQYKDGTVQAILSLLDFIDKPGKYEIKIDVPGFKQKHYLFVYLPGLHYNLDDAPYIFKPELFISFSETNITSSIRPNKGVFCFEIDNSYEKLDFVYTHEKGNIPFEIRVPVFKWSNNSMKYSIYPLETIWHADFSYSMDLKFSESFNIRVENDSESDLTIHTLVGKDGNYHCDLTPLKTWLFETDNSFSDVYVDYQNIPHHFARVFIQSKILGLSALSYNEITKNIEGSFDKYGDDKLYLSIKHSQSDTDLCMYLELDDNTFTISAEGLTGHYQVDIFTKRRGFGQTYKRIYSTERKILTNNLSGLVFGVIGHYFGRERFDVRRYRKKYWLDSVGLIERNTYQAELCTQRLNSTNPDLQKDRIKIADVRVTIHEFTKYWRSEIEIITIFEDEEDIHPILYDRQLKELVAEENMNLKGRERYIKYKELMDFSFDLELD